MEIVRMRANYVTFCGIFITAVIAIGSSDNSLTEENNFAYFCSNKNLSIDFSGSEMRVLGENFITSPLITCLDLEGNQIEEVREGAFSGLPELRYLNMAGNKISNLISFGSHTNLETLILANQSYDRYDPYNGYTNHYQSYGSRQSTNDREAFKITGRYPQLRYLDLSGNNIRSIDLVMEGNADYRDLNTHMPKLTYLDLSNNIIDRLFSEDSPSSSLTISLMHIYLRNNNMEFANLKYFRNIVVLIADNNIFKHLNKKHCFDFCLCIDNMSKLETLSVFNNSLNQIDRDFFEHMTKLAMLNLSNNNLNNDLDGIFDDLISLRNLDLDNNLLTSISIFKKPLQLSNLSVNWNKIKYINSEDFINMTKLRILYLNYNNLRNIDKNTFRLLNLLEELHLAGNSLTNLPAEWATNLKSLQHLDVTNNKFKYLESLSLSKTISLKRLDLIDNEIISITSKILRDISENVTIHLAHDQKEIEPKTSDKKMITSYDYDYN